MRVLHQSYDRTDGIKPGDNTDIEAKYGPQSLFIGELVGNFAESGSCGCIGKKIEGVEQAHVLDIAFSIPAWYQRHTSDAYRIDDDKDKNRSAQVAQHYHCNSIKF